MSENEKQLSKRKLLDFLQEGVSLPPIRLRVIEVEVRDREKNIVADALIEATQDDCRFPFAVELKTAFNPKAIREAVDRITWRASRLNANPLILTPYLSDEALLRLESKGVSGLDLCGNGVLVVPDRLLVYRTGRPNQYPSSSPIRNVYKGTSSIVSRAFLLKSKYETAQRLLQQIGARGGKVTLSTVSKVCSSLEDDLIIERQRTGRSVQLRLLQPDKLLSRLAENYAPPKVTRRFTGKLATKETEFQTRLREWKRQTGNRVVSTGTSSSGRYATMVREPIKRYYCTNVSEITRLFGETLRETDRFPNIELMETDDPTVYFDVRRDWEASPVQAYLELNAGDKRERETAVQIKQRLIDDVSDSRKNS